MENILVADVMTRGPVTAKPGDNLLSCAKKIVRKKVGTLPIVYKKKLIGLINERDILWALVKKSKEDLSKIKAIDISAKKIISIKLSATVRDAIRKMKKLKFERLPVINDNQLVGIITAKDILNFHPEFYPELEEFSRIRNEQEKLKRIKKAKERVFTYEGICEECGERDFLYKVHGMIICESCKTSV